MSNTIHLPGARRLSVAFFVLLLSFFARQESAQAKNKVVVLEFEGDRAEDFQEIVEDLAKSSVRIVSSRKFKKEKTRIRRFRGRAKDYQKIAERLDVDTFIEGSVSRRRGKYKLKLRFRGRDGEYGDERITLMFKKTRLSSSDERKLRKRLEGALRDFGDDDDDDDDYRDDDDDDDDDYRDDDDDDDDDYRDDDDDDDDDDYRDDDDYYDDDEYYDEEESGTRNRALEIEGGLSFSSRKLQFDFDSNVTGSRPQGYAGAMVPGLYIDASVFPAVFAKQKGFLGGFGVTLLVDRVFKIESKLQGQAMVLPTTQSRLAVGVVYRYNLSPDKASGPTIRASLRYTALDFTIDKTNAPGISIPNVDYTYIQPGVSMSFPVSPQITLSGGASFYIVRATGEIAELQQYGNAAVSGFEGQFGATFRVLPEVSLNAGVRYASIGYLFEGSGSLSDRDNDGAKDVSGATDSYLGFFTTAGYVF